MRARIGIDRSPIDVTTEDGARLLRSFVWAGQEGRMERLDRAIEALREDPPQLVQGDYVEELPGVLAALPREGLTVVFQTASSGYIGDEGFARYWVENRGSNQPRGKRLLRQELWRKGDTSGDRQFVREAYYDCDGDTLLFLVEQEGRGACHTGAPTCFFRRFGDRLHGDPGGSV